MFTLSCVSVIKTELSRHYQDLLHINRLEIFRNFFYEFENWDLYRMVIDRLCQKASALYVLMYVPVGDRKKKN